MHGADAGAPLQRQVCGTDRFIVAIIVYRVADGCAKDLIADLPGRVHVFRSSLRIRRVVTV
jgi:hypothetical protein